jgi:hypothetical protein
MLIRHAAGRAAAVLAAGALVLTFDATVVRADDLQPAVGNPQPASTCMLQGTAARSAAPSHRTPRRPPLLPSRTR